MAGDQRTRAGAGCLGVGPGVKLRTHGCSSLMFASGLAPMTQALEAAPDPRRRATVGCR
ncbi:hypothetical protein P280DRAFT_467341 [Massarina eburnea CBS 473.64]|uniref:Uncharacterized protein n=1 Tax=Massarina eburnea CBS 473.64 TaxID=1395130 RepID=A0A6A6S6C6_9PLEO|nr:hypothetical protein P280DRAFT_467341 [Massarina eburnea CBS 473.64]